MKRGLILIILTLLLISPLILAEDNVTTEAKEKISALAGGINDQTEDIFEKEVVLPSFLESIFKIVFGIKENPTIQQLIIVLGIWIGFFLLIFSISGIIPFFKGGLIQLLASITITILVSITGALNLIATFFFDLAGFFSWTASWGPLRTIIAVLIAVVFIGASSWAIKKLKIKLKIEEAKVVSQNIGTLKEVAEVESDNLDKLSE